MKTQYTFTPNGISYTGDPWNLDPYNKFPFNTVDDLIKNHKHLFTGNNMIVKNTRMRYLPNDYKQYDFLVAGYTAEDISIELSETVLLVTYCKTKKDHKSDDFFVDGSHKYNLANGEEIDEIPLENGVLSVKTKQKAKSANSEFKVGFKKKK